MKKTNIGILSFAVALALCACNQIQPNSDPSMNIPSNDSSVALASESDNNQKSSDVDKSSSSSSSSSKSSKSSESKEEVAGDNFTMLMPNNLSSMSDNCKQYVDDMRAQQKKLIQEKGADADYFINDLYGESGVDITKGVLSGNNGGYRDGKTQNDYLDDITAEWEKGEKSDESKGVEIEFKPKDSLKNKTYTISYDIAADFSGAKTITSTDTKVYLKNLLVNQKYYVKVSADGQESSVINFTTGDYPRWIDARPMFNVRDHGGYMTSSGQRIKQGMVYRGGEITPAVGWKSGSQYTGDVGGRYTDSNGKMQDGHITTQNADSKKVFREVMGMVGGLEIDLRSSSERNNYSACGFAENGDIGYSLYSISSYANGVNNNKSLIKSCFDAFAKANTKPVYYHCYGGADRTGTIGFLLGAVLGMSYTDLVIDFELTSYSSNPSRNYRSHLRNGPYNDWPNFINTLKNSYGFTSSKTIKQAAEEYLINQCKVTQSTIDTIRNIMLEPAN